MESILEKLRKVMALAEGGTDGERENAQAMLQRLCERHGVDVEQLLDEKVEPYEFKARGEEKKLLIQCAVFICRTYQIKNIQNAKDVTLWLTAAQAVDVRECFEHFKEEWFRYRSEAMQAFIHANRLHAPSEGDDDADDHKLTPEEMARIKRIGHMMLFAGAKPFRRALPDHQPPAKNAP